MPSWIALADNSLRFGYRCLAAYPGLDKDTFAEFQDDFGDHYNGRISTAELAVETGYALPPGAPRPASPGADPAALAAHP